MDIAARIGAIRDAIAGAEAAAGRGGGAVNLVAVSKKQPDARIDAALAAGLRVFGENRVQEAMTRWQERRDRVAGLQLRLIGGLQTNKAKDAVGFFDVIESIDRERLAIAVAAAAREQGRNPECLIQVNTGMEEQKSGIAPGEAVEFARFCREDQGLAVTGLMCIPPVEEEAAMHFALLAQLAHKAGLEGLSMGMSSDFAEAIAFGATHVRIGTGVFGERE